MYTRKNNEKEGRRKEGSVGRRKERRKECGQEGRKRTPGVHEDSSMD
jgi:hypothetical protein